MDAPNDVSEPGPAVLSRLAELWSHLQTATAALPLNAPPLAGVRSELLELPFPAGVVVTAAEWQPRTAPAVIMLHGVAGSSDDAYVMRAARALQRRGFHVVRVNQRGSGRGIGKSEHLYHAGLADDVVIVRRWLESRADVTQVGVLGFSLGGHVALTHAADVAGHAGRLGAVVSISAPVDLAATMRSFDKNRSTPFVIYERMMLRSLADSARALVRRNTAPFTAAELDAVADIRAFDDLVTSRCHGFAGVDDYHARASVGPRLAAIDVPTLMIHAADDPVVPVAPLRVVATSSAVDVVIVPRGGHVGFIDGVAALWGASTAVARAADHFERNLR